MSSDQPSPDTIPPDPHRERAERHLRVLQELAEIGMDLARLVRQRAMDADPATHPSDPGLAFARIARAVRQTVALEARLDEDAQTRAKRRAAEQAAEAARLAEAVRKQGSSHKFRAALIVEKAVLAESDSDGEDSDAERLADDLHEWLADKPDNAQYADRPIAELVLQICRDLGLTPDWSLWPDEDWAVELAARTEPPAATRYYNRELGAPGSAIGRLPPPLHGAGP